MARLSSGLAGKLSACDVTSSVTSRKTHGRNAIIENGIVAYRYWKALRDTFLYPLDASGIVYSTPTAIMPQANGNLSPERFVEPQPQRQSAVQIAIKNFSPVWYVHAFLICASLNTRLFLPWLETSLHICTASRKARCHATPVLGTALTMLDKALSTITKLTHPGS